MGSVYRPAGQKQLVASDPHGGVNCTAYVAATLADFATLGGVLVTGKQIRAWSNEPVPDPKSPGLNIGQVADVWRDELHMTLTNKTGGTWDDLVAAVKAHRGVLFSVWYETLPASYRAQSSPVGGHALGITAIDTSNRGLTWDPLRGAPLWIPLTALKAAALAFAKKAGATGVFYAQTRVVPLID